MANDTGDCIGCGRHILSIDGEDTDCCECEREPPQGKLVSAVTEVVGREAHGNDLDCFVYIPRAQLDSARSAIHLVGAALGVRYNPHDSRNNIGDLVMVTVSRLVEQCDEY